MKGEGGGGHKLCWKIKKIVHGVAWRCGFLVVYNNNIPSVPITSP